MRLKSNYILPILLLLMLFVSCSQEDGLTLSTSEESEGNLEICFSSTSTKPLVSRGGATETLPTDYKMWVAAIYHDQYNTSHKYYFGASIEKKFAWDTNISAWKGLEGHYYPLSGTMDFLAYAIQKDEHKPTPTYTPATLSPSGNTFSTLTLDFGTKLDGTDAVVFSDLHSGVTCGNQSGRQNLLFRQAMAKILFAARAEDAASASRFTIHRLTVKAVRTSGILQITPSPTTDINIGGNTATIGSKLAWTQLNGAAQNLDTYSNSTGMHPLLSATEGSVVGSPLYLPTQSAANIDIEIEYTITNSGNTTSHLTKTISLGAADWKAGQQYTYTLVVSLTQIYIETQVNGAIIDTTPEDIDLDEQYNGKNPVS